MSLYVEGTLTNRSWTDQNGQKRYSTDVNMDTFQLLTPRGQGGAPAAGGFSQATGYQPTSFNGQQNSAPSYDAGMVEEDVDLPF